MNGSDGKTAGDRRKARLAEELRANLARRKEQARSRRAGREDSPPARQPATKTKKKGGD